MSKQELNKAYLNTKVNWVIEPMVKAILRDLPEDLVDYMHKYILENHGDWASIHKNERIELESLWQEVE